MSPFKERPVVTDLRKAMHYTDLQSMKPTRQGDPYEYMAGFGNRFQSEVIPGTLPVAQNNPQEVRFGLYTEGITYSAFAAPRHSNYSTYWYRARPSTAHGGIETIDSNSDIESCFLSLNDKAQTLPDQVDWTSFPLPDANKKTDFIDGLHTLGGSGDPNLRQGIAQHVYTINASMYHRAFCNTDGDMLLAPQLGNLDVWTELGRMFLQPGEIAVIQRGLRLSVKLGPGVSEARGYITEIWGSMWELPDLGPIGGHGLANPRDFLHPVAWIEDDLHVPYKIVNKINGRLATRSQDHSPFDLVAWHGNVVPYKYDLTKFVSQNTTSVDHTDPSVYTVLTAKSNDPLTPLADFVWLGPRWDAASNTFRPPYFHRNSASEFVACLYNENDASISGACSFQGSHTPHGGFGPESYVNGMGIRDSEPEKVLTNQMTILVESSRLFLWTEYARTHAKVADPSIWDVLPDNFSANKTAIKLLKQVKEDNEANRRKRDSYLIGGFTHGINADK